MLSVLTHYISRPFLRDCLWFQGVTFPPTAAPEAKAVLLAAVFLIDFMFFEDGGAAEGGGGFGDD